MGDDSEFESIINEALKGLGEEDTQQALEFFEVSAVEAVEITGRVFKDARKSGLPWKISEVIASDVWKALYQAGA